MQPWIDGHPLEFGVLLFLTLWVSVFVVISYISGWAELAQQFRYRARFVGKRWRGQSAQMRWIVGYRNCLTVGANPDGLYLATLFLFRVGHPPLFVPWIDVSSMRRGKWFLFRYVELRFGRERSIPFRITEGLADRLKQAAGKAWPIESIG